MMEPNWPLSWHPDLGRWEVHYSLTHPDSNWEEVWHWCLKTFGHPVFTESGTNSSWDYRGGWIYFYDEKYVTLYKLRWA